MMRIDWLDKLQHMLQMLAFTLALAAIQYVLRPDRSYETLVRYCLCIGTSIWLLIDFGRHLFPSSAELGWPKGVNGLVLPMAGNVAGFLIGTALGDWWNGWPWSTFAPEHRGELKISIVITVVAGAVISYFFYSTSKSARLVFQMREAKKLAAESRLKLLETQLEPHMMFNTLANLRVLIGIDPTEAQRMLDHMIAYLRATLGASRNTSHSLSAEFDRLRDYLELMAVRMGPRLQYTLNLPADLRDHPVPTLLLQPLVENAIKHGLEPKIEGGSITVTARWGATKPSASTPDQLILEVIDTGVGVTLPAPLAPAASTDSGFGLAQVRERLTATYGKPANVTLTAPPSGGTQVTLCLPL